MSRRALVIGIDDYPTSPLTGCVSDAVEVATLLETHGNGDPNFGIKTLTSDKNIVSRKVLREAVISLFQAEADMVLFYFAGHGLIDAETNGGFIVAQDGDEAAPGFALSELLELANSAHPKIKSTVLILDSCSSGAFGEVSGLASGGKLSVIGNGVTILTATHRSGTAREDDGHGVFTHLLSDGLRGSAADICGRVTPAALYTHVDQTLGEWEQRPVYKANVQTFVIIRKVPPKVALETLRRLPAYFPDTTATFKLDPSFEPNRGEETEKLKEIPVIDENYNIYRELQACNRHGLVMPVDREHMWDAAVYSTGCRLTATGAHYRRLAEMKRI
uniref:Caspase domain protein n=1 Tax=Rhizobium rhizogenes TaxID=359 RepID=A0A7S5DR67_RHIRH|nr:caspase family protein [Rhizobium rhizogenes]QCL10613.1 caspase domain protein [Rhizobium rhizogenes]